MLHSKQELLTILDRFKDLHLLVVGDLILDRYIWGNVDRISPEAPVPIVDVTRTEDRLGGAGNVVRNLCQLGAKVSLCGFVGDDDEGQVVLSLLQREGIGRDGVLLDRSRPTALKTRVIAHAQQIVRIDREKRGLRELPLREGFAAVVDAHIDSSHAVIISDYGKGTISPEVMTKLSGSYSSGRLGLHSRPLVLDPHPVNHELYRGVSVAKPNRKEAEVASGKRIVDQQSAFEAAKVLLSKWEAELIVITLGEDGLVMSSAEGESLHLPTRAVEVFDVSGAGDTVTAIFSAALSAGAIPSMAGELANIGAGIVVSEVGTVAISEPALRMGIEQL